MRHGPSRLILFSFPFSAAFGMPRSAAAQQPQTEIEAVQEIWGMVKKELVDQYMQLENYLQTAIRHEVQEAIPFIGELERKRQ